MLQCIALQFGFPFHSPGGRAYSNAHFGAGSGPIFLDGVQCSSSASQLLECPSRPILSHNCRHSADAGVGCEGILYHCRASFRILLKDGESKKLNIENLWGATIQVGVGAHQLTNSKKGGKTLQSGGKCPPFAPIPSNEALHCIYIYIY